MSKLKEKLASQLAEQRKIRADLVKEHGDVVVSKVDIRAMFGGLRGVIGMICDTSSVEPDQGLIIRGIPIKQLKDRLPEEVLWLLITGEMPNAEELADLQDDLKRRSHVPEYVFTVLRNLPSDSHPMAMFNTAILCMQKESIFAAKYEEGSGKDELWDYALEDCLNMIAKLPAIAAAVYRIRFYKGPLIAPNMDLDWAGNYAHMLGLPDPDGQFQKLIRMYMVLHSDHEGGNVSAFTARCVSSALSDPYYSVSAGLNGLAGPLHGLANQECLRWVLMVQEKFGGVPTDEQLREFAWETLSSGQVIPGYGHAVLRVTDPRFEAIYDFGKECCANDPVFQIVMKIFEVVPGVLTQVQKIKDPWPNVDAVSGALLYHYGLTEFPVYTVLFSVSRALGICSQFVMSRAQNRPIIRPKSVTTDWVIDYVKKQKAQQTA